MSPHRVGLGVVLAADGLGQRLARSGIGDLDDLLQVFAAGVEPSTFQHRGHRQRRGRRIVDRAPTAAIAVPSTVRADGVHDVEVDQFDRVGGQRLGQHVTKCPVFVVAQPAARPLCVDDDRDGRVGSRRRGDVGEVADVVDKLRGKVHAHNATQLPTVDGDQNE